MRKLSNKEIERVNNRLIASGFRFIDIRIEVLDHLLCLIENDEDSSFDEVLNRVFSENSDYLKKVKQSTLSKIIDQRITFLSFFKKRLFWIVWISCFLFYFGLPYSNYKDLFESMALLPMQIPFLGLIYYVIYFLFSKNKITQVFGVFFTVSFVLYLYLLLVNYVKQFDNVFVLLFLSGGTAVSLMMYYWLFYYKAKNNRKFKNLMH